MGHRLCRKRVESPPAGFEMLNRQMVRPRLRELDGYRQESGTSPDLSLGNLRRHSVNVGEGNWQFTAVDARSAIVRGMTA